MELRTFRRLRDFVVAKMRTQHVYQPVMLKTLLENSGRATTRQIAAAFLALDQTQLDSYEIITKRMPASVLRRHGIVHHDKSEQAYQLMAPVEELSESERAELIALCDAKLAEFLERRAETLYAHRQGPGR